MTTDDLHVQLNRIEASMRNLRVMGDSGIRISGDMLSGLKVELDEVEEVVSVSVGTTVLPPEPCTLPDEDCAHIICFDFKVDQSEQDDNSQPDLFDLIHIYTSSAFAGFWIDWDAQTYSCFSAVALVGIPIPDINSVPGIWHSVQFTAWTDSGASKCRFVIDGLDSGEMTFTTETDCQRFDRIRFGASNFGGTSAHRSIRNISALSYRNTEGNFDFPPDSFVSLVGSASIAGTDLRIDTDDATESYGETELDLPWNLNCGCLCPRDLTEISAMDVTLSFDADFHDATCGTGTRSDSFVWNFIRIDRVTSFTPGNLEFKLYLQDPSDGPCNDLIFETSLSVFPHDWGKADNICATGDFRFPVFTSSFSADCCSGTLDLANDNLSSIAAIYKDTGSDCLGAPCDEFIAETNDDLANGIPFVTDDFANLIGTYTLSHTASNADADITITLQLVIS